MPGFGFGIRAGRGRRPLGRPGGPVAAPPVVSPATGWTGAAGSGFASTPTDPARTTAKPALRLLTPPNQYFTDELLVGVIAGANDGGTLLTNLGIAKVTAHYEGTAVDIAAPSFRTFADANGNPVTYFGWWARLKRDGRSGDARLYFEAVARDAAMQHRVIGPYTFYPAAAVHDAELEVAPSQPAIAGQRYQTFKAAGDYCRTNAKQNPRITFTEGGTHAMQRLAGGYAPKGRVTLQATQPITLTQGDTDASYLFRMLCPLHVKGEAITIDLAGANQFYIEAAATQYHWLDGCTLTDSGGYPGYYYKQSRSSGQIFNSGGWFTEATVSNLVNALTRINLARGCRIGPVGGDLFTGTQCVVGNTVDTHDDSPFVNGVPSVMITYTGAAASATVEAISGTRTFTFKAGGATVGTFACNTAVGSTANYTNQHFVDYVNGLGNGWSAALLNNDVYANALSLQTGTPGAAIPATSVKNTALTLNGRLDYHGDWYQSFGGVTNLVVYGNVATKSRVQGLFIDGNLTDAVWINNAWHNNEAAAGTYLLSNSIAVVASAHSHVSFAHNTWATQIVRLDGTRDSYCMWKNNVGSTMAIMGSGSIANLNAADNHLQAGPVPSGFGGTTTGGTNATLYADSAGGDFAPAGALLANLKAPVVRYDRKGTVRGATAAVGAVA